MNKRKLWRPRFDEVWMSWADTIAERSTCPRLQVGAVIVNAENQPLVAGYNGAPRGVAHCSDVGCLKDDAGHCRRALHAEHNAILQAAQTNISIAGGTMYVTHQPCATCSVILMNSGLKEVVFRESYPIDPSLKTGIYTMMQESGVMFRATYE